MAAQQYNLKVLDSSISEQEQIKEEVLAEERKNAEKNYGLLEQMINDQRKSIPYPDVSMDEVGIDYPDREALAWKKSENQPYWDEMERIGKYAKCEKLYCGHLRFQKDEYYFTEDLRFKTFVSPDQRFFLINTEDKDYQDIRNAWTNPIKEKDVTFSRNIMMEKKAVTDVDIKFDSRSELLSNITDAYLRNALIRNKDKEGIQSIIQTIQQNQDRIRMLDKSRSFVVQGCAGSGKTLVLLHRMRYLIYNKYIKLGEYILLIPGTYFKDYISKDAERFGINQRYISSYCDYYKELLNKTSDLQEYNELVLPPSYLKQVYSKEFIQDAYRETLGDVQKSVNLMISTCEDGLNDLYMEQEEALDHTILSLKERAFRTAKEILQPIEKYLEHDFGSYADIAELSNELSAKIASQSSKIQQASDSAPDIEIAPDDPRITSDTRIIRLTEEISAEKAVLGKASIFTRKSHERKMQALNDAYEDALKEVTQKLIEEEKARLLLLTAELQYVFPNTSVHDAKDILKRLNEELEKAHAVIASKLQEKDHFDSQFEETYHQAISSLNRLTDMSSAPEITSESYIDDLCPNSQLVSYVRAGIHVYQNFEDLIHDSDKLKEFQKQRVLFKEQSDSQILSYLNTKLLNTCKRRMKDAVQLEDDSGFEQYKHYWYLCLYAHYLIYGSFNTHYPYIFIDEAQDLSPSEIELIYKINSIPSGKRLTPPVINLFGDTNQAISMHSISDWDTLPITLEQYYLKENFRNTNQIVAYCNSCLPFHMQEVGVDMDEVRTFRSVVDFIGSKSPIAEGTVFIVKDQQSAEKLKDSIKDTANANCSVLTVKDSKGLEFRDVIVVDCGMSINEKYIAYTRALANLTVIHSGSVPNSV